MNFKFVFNRAQMQIFFECLVFWINSPETPYLYKNTFFGFYQKHKDSFENIENYTKIKFSKNEMLAIHDMFACNILNYPFALRVMHAPASVINL